MRTPKYSNTYPKFALESTVTTEHIAINITINVSIDDVNVYDSNDQLDYFNYYKTQRR